MLPIHQINKTTPVLIVEDEALIASELEQMLLGFGFDDIHVCLRYSAAVEQVKMGNFGLAIFDINVGGMLSFGLISSAISQGWAVVTISGYIEASEVLDGRVFLPKPIDPKRLVGAIAQAHEVSRIAQLRLSA